jgi:hypothetical protein
MEIAYLKELDKWGIRSILKQQIHLNSLLNLGRK